MGDLKVNSLFARHLGSSQYLKITATYALVHLHSDPCWMVNDCRLLVLGHPKLQLCNVAMIPFFSKTFHRDIS